jgi:hypothetical protein
MSAQLKHYLGLALESCIEYFAPRLMLLALIAALIGATLVPSVFLVLGLVGAIAFFLFPRKKNLRSAVLPSDDFGSETHFQGA